MALALLGTPKVYDPAAAVSKSTAALLAMTAFDTTNLRYSFTVPASGIVQVRIVTTIHGAVTSPGILIGVMEGATVKAKIAPSLVWAGAQAATSLVSVEALFPVTGLTPATSLSWDAAYSVETLVASSAIKYGGPNDGTANNAFGAFIMEIYG